MLVRDTDDGLELRDLLTGKTASFPGGLYAGPLYLSVMEMTVSEAPYLSIRIETVDGYETWLIDESLEKTAVFDNDSVSAICDSVTGEEYLVVEDFTAGRYELLTTALEPVAVCSAYPAVQNGRIFIQDEWSFTCTDLAGNVIFRRSFITSQDD